MELQKFIEMFLPNFEEKLKESVEFSHTVNHCEDCVSVTLFLIENYFPEALQNYTDKICEKQRENCAKLANVLLSDMLSDFGVEGIEMTLTKKDGTKADAITMAKQPKIEELV